MDRQAATELLKRDLFDYPGVIDPEDVFHVFASGMIGRKCDLDQLPADSLLFRGITEASIGRIKELYPKPPDIILTVANGGNRFVPILQEHLHRTTSVQETKKNPSNSDILLSERAKEALQRRNPELVVIFDDLGTTGSTAAKVADKVMSLNVSLRLEVFTPVYRQDRLERLEERDIAYHGLIRITDDLPTYTEKKWLKFVADREVTLIPHGQ